MSMNTSKNIVMIVAEMNEDPGFYGRPLHKVKGRPLIHWVYDRATQLKLVDQVVIVSPDEEVWDYCREHHLGHITIQHKIPDQTVFDYCIMAYSCIKVGVLSNERTYDRIIYWNCNEPLVDLEDVEQLIDTMKYNTLCQIATLVSNIDEKDGEDQNILKTFVRHRCCCKFVTSSSVEKLKGVCGVWGFVPDAFLEIEKILYDEGTLIQNKWLQLGLVIDAVEIDQLPLAINSPSDLVFLNKLMDD